MAYTPNAYDTTRPVDADIAETAQLEFRTMKAFYKGTVGRAASAQIATSAVPTNLAVILVPAAVMSTNRKLKYRASGVISNATGGAITVTFNVSYGASVVNQCVVPIAANGNYAFDLDWQSVQNGTTNTQLSHMKITTYGDGSITGTGISAISAIGGTNSGATDTTAAANFAVLVTNSSAGAITSVLHAAALEWS